MKQPTFKEQFDKLTAAYVNGEVVPCSPCACFIGNLLNGRSAWMRCRIPMCSSFELFKLTSDTFLYHVAARCIYEESGGLYSTLDIAEMESVFMSTYIIGGSNEESLFNGFSKALDLLKEIHESKGEVVDTFTFTKRTLTTCS